MSQRRSEGKVELAKAYHVIPILLPLHDRWMICKSGIQYSWQMEGLEYTFTTIEHAEFSVNQEQTHVISCLSTLAF
jgi:hypothetical protein